MTPLDPSAVLDGGPPVRISVCLCTYRRPQMLRRTLEGIVGQAEDPRLGLEVVVVDNDPEGSAAEVVRAFQGAGPVPFVYDLEPVKNIALARNRSIRHATGGLIATIDDDEFPGPDWLGRMTRCLTDFQADGVLGPVLPDFPAEAPSWLKRSGLCDRPRNATGARLRGGDLRTGNALFKRTLFEGEGPWFDPSYGLIGGSDGVFINGQIRLGRKFVWCDDAVVYETVPPDRWPADYYYRRFFRIGTMQGRSVRVSRGRIGFLKSAVLLLALGAASVLSLLTGKAMRVRLLSKAHYQIGFILSYLKLVAVPERR